MRLVRIQLRIWRWLRILVFTVSLIALAQLSGQAILIKEVPNPQKLGDTWITDMAELIDPVSEAKLNQMISDLEQTTSAEIAIVTVYNTHPSPTPKAFATELFNTWGIGKQGRDNGVLFLISKDERRTEIEIGTGLGDRLPDAKVKRILQRQVTPQFRAGNFDAGIVDGTTALIAAIEGHGWTIQNLSIQQYGTACLLVATAFFAQRVLKRKTSARVRLSPIQKQTLPPINRWQGWIFWGIRWLAGNQIFKVHLPTLQELEENYTRRSTSSNWLRTHRYPKMFPEMFEAGTPTPQEVEQTAINHLASVSWLQVYHYPRQLTNYGLKLLLAGIILGIGITSMLPRDSFTLFFMMPVYPLLWLGYEMWKCTQWAKRLISQSDADQAKREILGKISCLCFACSAVFMLLGLVNINVAIGAVVGIIFACAGSVRYIRLNPLNDKTVVCTDCASPMTRLSLTELDHRLTKSQKIEMGLKSMVYEGWHCSNHGTTKPERGLDSHLIAYMVKNNAIGYCSSCDGLTVEITNTVKKAATSVLPGCKVITQKCHCCDRTTQTEELIPKRSASHRQNRNSYINSYDHTNSSYHGSDSGSSGSSYDAGSHGFGSGSSDGGGAGDSW